MVDQDADAEGDSREGDDETDDSESPNPDNSNTTPTPVNPVNPNAGQTGGGDDASDGMEGDEAGTPTDQDGNQTLDKGQQTDAAVAPAQFTDGDEEDSTETDGGEESPDEDDDPDESVDQGTEAEGANIEVDRAEGAGGTDSTDSDNNAGGAIDGPDSMPMPQPNSPGTVTLTGTATEDETLTATLTDADGLPDDAANIRYQWQRDTGANDTFDNIAGATSPTYTLGDADVGREMRVQVSYTDGNNTAETLTSAPTTAVSNINDNPTGAVTISGQATEDQTLTANTDTLDDADGLGSFRYQWQRTGADGTFADIEDATEQTYTVKAADVDQRLQVVVRYTDGNDTDETLTAATVSAAASNATDPVIDDANIVNGTADDDSNLQIGAGSQRINGLGGDDSLLGSAGADILDGGDGTDTVSYASNSADIEIDLETGTGKGGNAEGDVLISIEDILGGTGNDRLTGNNTDNRLNGFFGNDRLDGGEGDDGLAGSLGNDTLNGGSGNDRLNGGDDDDILTGGSGNDLFRFRPDHGSDRITDFGTGDGRLEFREGLFANLEAVRAAATQTDDGNLEIALSETEILTLEGVTRDALTAETVTTLDREGKDTTTPPADANSASDAPAFELDDLLIDEEALMRLAASEGMTLNPPEFQAAQSASEKLALADPLEPPPALALFDADLEGYSGL